MTSHVSDPGTLILAEIFYGMFDVVVKYLKMVDLHGSGLNDV